MPASSSRIAVIGAGSVGAAVSYAILLRQVCSELLLVDIDTARAEGEVEDMSDGAFVTNSKVRTGTAQEAGQCDIIVITAGAKQREGETRVQLIDRNHNILKSVIGGMQPICAHAKILVVANPVDILTYFAQKMSGLPKEQVFGSGTVLDSARLRNSIARKVQVADTAVNAYVLGEHGDSQFVAWSLATIGGVPIAEFPALADQKLRDDLAEKTKNKAYHIIKLKGATYFGIAAVVSEICLAVFMNRLTVMPVSVYHEEYKVCISALSVVGSSGVLSRLPMKLSADESKQLKASADSLFEVIKKYDI